MLEYDKQKRKRIERYICAVLLISLALAPFTAGISIIVVFCIIWGAMFFGGITKSCSSSRARRMETLEQATIIAESYESQYGSPDIIINGTNQDDYSFPKRCPFCDTELLIGNLKWVDSTTALCPNCESTIQAT